jgi:hypothetical protein
VETAACRRDKQVGQPRWMRREEVKEAKDEKILPYRLACRVLKYFFD